MRAATLPAVRRLLIVLLLLAGLGVVARGAVPCDVLAVQPSCYIALSPGPAEDTLQIVQVSGTRAYSSAGELLLTTVSLDPQLDVVEWIRGAFSPRVEELPRRQLIPPGHGLDEVLQANVQLMTDSQHDAAIAALHELGYQFDTDYDGATVEAIADDGSVTDGALQVGDVITAVDGETVTDNRDVVRMVGEHAVGDTVTFTVQRGDETRTADVTLVENPQQPGTPFVGITVSSYLQLPVDIQIDAGQIGGPSAGLMFALSIVDKLGADDLTGGQVIAGTGEIDRAGNVGPIGGIQQKVIGAVDRGGDRRPASVFLVPEDNLAAARHAAVDRDVLLVPVGTLHDAVQALQSLRDGKEPAGALALSAG